MWKSYKKEIIGQIEGKLEGSMGKVGAIVERQAKINVSQSSGHPQVQTGDLRGSIKYRVESDKKTISALIGSTITKPSYPYFLEFGTSRMPPYPWLFPAVEMRKKEIIAALKDKL